MRMNTWAAARAAIEKIIRTVSLWRFLLEGRKLRPVEQTINAKKQQAAVADATAQQTLNHPVVPDKQHRSRVPTVKIPAMSVERSRV